MKNQIFILTEDHLKLARRMYISWQDCEYGAPEVNPKRPYGNSTVGCDIAEILEWKNTHCSNCGEPIGDTDWDAKARAIHEEMGIALQIILQHAGNGILTGKWVNQREYGHDWRYEGKVPTTAEELLKLPLEEQEAYLKGWR